MPTGEDVPPAGVGGPGGLLIDVDTAAYTGVRTPWERAEWRSDLLGWIRDRLREHGMTAAGRLRVRLRPWSVVMRIPLSSGPPVWFKASPPAARFEAGLVSALALWRPGAVIEPIATDAEHGWMLLPDGGTVLHELPVDRRMWERMLGDYARLQRHLASRVDGMLALGVPDARTARLPQVFEETVAALPAGGSAREDLRPIATRVRAAARSLAASGVPDSLDHADVHDGQVLVGTDGRPVVFDWGDASVAHPFGSLRVPLTRAVDVLGADALPRLRESYLDAWSDLASPADLRAAVRTAWRLATIARAGTWGRLFPGSWDDAGWKDEQVRWLLRFDDDPPPTL